MVKIRVGIIMALAALIFLCFAVINQRLTAIEIVIISLFCIGVMFFGLSIEKRKNGGIFPQFKEEFNEERKF